MLGNDTRLLDLVLELSSVEHSAPISILRTEARLLGLIKGDPGHAVKYYLNKSGMSYRGFFNTLGILMRNGMIREEKNEVDKRQKLLF
jgi:DNA-binding MarR family transcriptional regulator